MNERDLNNLLHRGKRIAQNNSPFDTGNLKFNAIKAFKQGTGGVIRIDGRDAYYAQFLEEGKGRSDIHKGFIKRIESEIEKMVLDYFKRTVRGRGRIKLRNAKQERMNLNEREARLERSRTRFDRDVDMK